MSTLETAAWTISKSMSPSSTLKDKNQIEYARWKKNKKKRCETRLCMTDLIVMPGLTS